MCVQADETKADEMKAAMELKKQVLGGATELGSLLTVSVEARVCKASSMLHTSMLH